MLTYEDDKSHGGNSCHPRIADQLRIERQQPRGCFGITAGGRFPVHQATRAIEFTDGVDVGDKLVAVGQVPNHLELQIFLRLRNANPIVPRKAFEEMHTLVEQAIPALSSFVCKRSIAESAPLPMKRRGTIVTAKIGLQRLFKATAKEHRCTLENAPNSSTEQRPIPYALRRARLTARVSAMRNSAPCTMEETLEGSASPYPTKPFEPADL